MLEIKSVVKVEVCVLDMSIDFILIYKSFFLPGLLRAK